MSVIELKQKLINKIESIEDVSILEDIHLFFEIESNNYPQYEFTEEQLNIVRERELDAENGDVVAHEDVMKNLSKWIGK
jgi:hypothetical protein